MRGKAESAPPAAKEARSRPFAEGFGPGLAYLGYRAGAAVVRSLPISVGNLLARLAGAIWFRADRRRRENVRRNLARVVGNGPALDGMVRKAFHSYARYWLETFRLARYGEDDLEEMVEAVGFDLIAKALRHGRGMVAITAHFGFYDLGLAWVGAHGYRVSTVAEVLKPRALFEWFAGERESRGWYVIPASPGSAALRRLLGTLRRGEIICLVGDRDLSRRGVSVCLFGEETTMPAGPSLMLAKTGAPLLLAGIHQIGPRRYRLEFNELAYERTGDETVDIPVIAQRIADAVEELVRRAPEQWHLFSTNWPSDEPHLPPRGRPGRR